MYDAVPTFIGWEPIAVQTFIDTRTGRTYLQLYFNRLLETVDPKDDASALEALLSLQAQPVFEAEAAHYAPPPVKRFHWLASRYLDSSHDVTIRDSFLADIANYASGERDLTERLERAA